MAQNKSDKIIREKLNAREIQPSHHSWDRLDAMLSVAEEKQNKRSFSWLYLSIGIAASILVIVSIGVFNGNQNNSNIKMNENVVTNETKVDTVKISIEKENFQVKNSPVQINQQLVQAEKNNIRQNNSTISNQQFFASSSKTLGSKNNNQEVSIIIKNQKNTISQNQEKTVQIKKHEEFYTNEIISTPVKEIVSIENNVASKKQSSIKVDAISLLNEVDGELEQTFRQKVISKISKNYQEVKVALANRNNQN